MPLTSFFVSAGTVHDIMYVITSVTVFFYSEIYFLNLCHHHLVNVKFWYHYMVKGIDAGFHESWYIYCNIVYSTETYLKTHISLKTHKNPVHPYHPCYFPNHFEILHRARQYHCCALCKISKRSGSWETSYRKLSFCTIWVQDMFLGDILGHCNSPPPPNLNPRDCHEWDRCISQTLLSVKPVITAI